MDAALGEVYKLKHIDVTKVHNRTVVPATIQGRSAITSNPVTRSKGNLKIIHNNNSMASASAYFIYFCHIVLFI